MKGSARVRWARLAAAASRLLLALTLWAEAPALWAQSPNPDTPELKEVQVDLASGTIRAVLPFDEPFILTGSPPANTLRIEATFCEIEGETARQLGNLTQGPNARAALSLCRGEATKLVPWNAQTANFQLFVPERLIANRNYLFDFTVFRALAPAELDTLKSQVRVQLEGAFLDLARSAPPSLSAKEYNQLLAAVRQVLAGFPMPSGLSLRAEAGSAWAASTVADDGAATEPPWQEQLRQVWEAQQQRAPIAQRLDTQAVPALFTALSSARANPALSLLQRSVEGLSAADRANLAHLLPAPAVAAVDGLVGSSDDRLSSIARGLEGLGGSGPTAGLPADRLLRDLWIPAEAVAQGANYQATADNLRAAAQLTLTAAQVTVLADALGSAAEQMAALGAALDAAADAADALASGLSRLGNTLSARQEKLDELAGYLRREAAVRVPVIGSSTGAFTTRATFHISVDFGILYAGEIGEVQPYFGANFYTRAVNRDVPLSELGGLRRRFSFLLGVTFNTVKETDTTGRVLRDDLFGSQALVVGAGLRLTDTARLNAGMLVFQENSPNPLIDRLELTQEAFVAISFDWNVKNLLGRLGASIVGP